MDALSRLTQALQDRYRIERELGAGGMATVYLAEDLRHRRKVALKVLKPELAAVVGADRFLAEIETTAKLQHPHILPLFDSGTADTFLFYVMPYVEGESLRDRLDREHQLPVDDAVKIAVNIAEALEYAHGKGVIHRDIKPANVLLLQGKPVLSDFGIALAVGAAGGGRLTKTGLSLGTPHYMSPEQATGDDQVGPATDIYAVGCVLFEMLVGEPPYTGSTLQAVLGKIMTEPAPAVTKHRKTAPPNVEATIRRALEKVPADRFSRAGDFARALGDAGFRYEAEQIAVGGAAVRSPWNPLSIGLAITTVLSVLGLAWLLSRPNSESRPLARFEVTLGDSRALENILGVNVALSRDGSRIVYVGAASRGGTQLWQRALDQVEPEPIPGTEGALSPVLSPDGLSVAFDDRNAKKTVAIRGGPSFTVVGTSLSTASAWGPDGMIYIRRDGVIHRVPATGGEPEAVTSPTENAVHEFPDVLPDGRGLLLTVMRGSPELARIAVVGPEGGEVREILTGVMARYATSGHVVYATAEGALMAAPFDLRRLEVTGSPVALLEGVRVTTSLAAQFALSDMGTLIYQTGAAGRLEFVWVTRSGAVSTVSPGETLSWSLGNRNDGLRLSPDGSRVAFTHETDGNADIWTKELPHGPMSRLTFDEAPDQLPAWTPDGRGITFGSQRGLDNATRAGPQWRLWTQPANGAGDAVLTYGDSDSWAGEGVWSPDGTWLVMREQGNSRNVLAIRPGVDSVARTLIAAPGVREQYPAISRDGRWLAYSSNETRSGREEIFVRPFPNVTDGKWQISTGGGVEPVWAHNGRELFFLNPVTFEVAVAEFSTTGGSFEPGRVTTLFTAPAGPLTSLLIGGARVYDVARDDDQFLMTQLVGSETPPKIVLVQNFFEELNARVPVR